MEPSNQTLSFADNATKSTHGAKFGLYCAGLALVGVTVPDEFVGTAVTFENAFDDFDVDSNPAEADFYVVNGVDGNPLTVPVVAGEMVMVPPANYAGFTWMRVVSNASETGGPLEIIVSLRHV